MISAKDLIIHYHRRWEVEISFCEIKTHQCATLKGQMPTIFRSKTSELVEQELYAMLIAYNLLRDLIYQSANAYNKNPLLNFGFWILDFRFKEKFLRETPLICSKLANS